MTVPRAQLPSKCGPLGHFYFGNNNYSRCGIIKGEMRTGLLYTNLNQNKSHAVTKMQFKSVDWKNLKSGNVPDRGMTLSRSFKADLCLHYYREKSSNEQNPMNQGTVSSTTHNRS